MAKADYDQLEKDYVTGDLSIRALAAQHDISWSAVADQARKRNWSDKRAAYRDSVAARTYERAAAEFADQKAEITNESLLVLRATVRKYGERLMSGDAKPEAKDAVMAIDKIMLIMGDPTERREEKHLGINITAGPGELDFVRQLLAEARQRSLPGGVGSDSPPMLENASEG